MFVVVLFSDIPAALALLVQLIAFASVRLIGFPLDSGLLYFFVDTLGFGKLIGKLFGSLIMFVFNYLTNKFVVFKIKD